MNSDHKEIKPSGLSRSQIEEAARETLRHHGLHSIPVNPVEVAHKLGIVVHNAKFADDSISGMIARRGEVSSILVNRDDSKPRKRFTIAHELGHHFLHLMEEEGEFVDYKVDLLRSKEEPGQKKLEVQANQFAAALLMPAEALRKAFSENQNPTSLSEAFQVSEEAMAIRLGQLGLI